MINEKGQFIVKDLTNKRIGKLTLIKRVNKKSPGSGQYIWLAYCDCGNKIETRPGKNKSCGCLIGNSGHKMTHTRFYKIWEGINIRTKYPRGNGDYAYHGIKNLWKSFEEFKNDIYESYLEHIKKFGEKNTQIDRVDNNGHYEKSNCRWVTLKEQARNKSNNVFITFNGETKCIAEWVEIFKIPYFTLRARLKKWSPEKALTTPVKR